MAICLIEMKRLLYILSIVLAAVSCADIRHSNPYDKGLHVLTVAPDLNITGAEVRVEDMNTGSRYVSQTSADGTATFALPNGLYRVTLSGRDGSDVFNASADKVVVSGSDYNFYGRNPGRNIRKQHYRRIPHAYRRPEYC